jgi:hypothetical protein
MPDHILITCPTSSVAVKTGFRAPRGSRISDLKRVTLRNCPACGQDHVWTGDMGYWDDESPPMSLWEEVRRIWRGRRRH